MARRVLIAAGGTGGHIYPALTIARSLQQEQPDIEIHFVGTPSGLENKIVPREGFPLHHVQIGRLNSNVSKGERLRTLLSMPFAFIQSLILVLKLNPIFIVGVGGHASGPVLLMASLIGKKTFIWEPNAYPGMANRILSRFVTASLVVFDEANRILRTKHKETVGMPIRKEIEQIPKRQRKPGEPFHVLVFGGSQGARGINSVVSQAISENGDWMNGVEIVHQTGPYDYEKVQDIYEGLKAPVALHEYLYDMDARYQWADLVVSRAGTGTLSELAACGKAAVMVPLPTAADNHQQKNAEALVKADAARMILQKDFTPDVFKQTIEEFKSKPEMVDALAKNIQKFHKPEAGKTVAHYLLNSVK